MNLPDLPSALLEVTNAFSEGQIQPPHIVIGDTLKMTKHTIHGWYAKSGNQVYGIIQVGWRFENNKPYACTNPYFDDKYYLIQQNSDLIIPLETKDLFEILNPELKTSFLMEKITKTE